MILDIYDIPSANKIFYFFCAITKYINLYSLPMYDEIKKAFEKLLIVILK